MRIAKATKAGRWNKAKVLSYLLTHSFYAKLWAIKRVTSNKGKNTPGIDGVLWKSSVSKRKAIDSLKLKGYKPQPLLRIYIPKKNGSKRPLSIPTMKDRAMQALFKLALAPIAETTADRNSYGFREGRSCADAISAAFNALSKPNSATWILEGDISGCFDNISHEWLLDNIPMNKSVLTKWLKAGYYERGLSFPTHKGTPQGGIISPTLANMVLDGLNEAIHKSVPRRSRVNFIRYADDFIVTAKSPLLLSKAVLPAITLFLKERGLSLSKEKTVITHINDGFTFLGQTFRKYGNTLRITPCKSGTLALIHKVNLIIRKFINISIPMMIRKLNETLRGWAYYHRHVVASEIFGWVDSVVYHALWRALKRIHNSKSVGWIHNKYWSSDRHSGVFAFSTKSIDGKSKTYKLLRSSEIKIRRHRKIIAEANPYLPEFAGYFYRRRHVKESRFLDGFTSKEIRFNYGY